MAETKRITIPAAEEILGGYFPVLDHGFIALKDYMGADEAIEEAARLSYRGGTRAVTAMRKLLRFLKRHDHTTPFEMIEVKIHVSMPIFVARQWIRQRTASLNEVSGRYSLLPMLFYTPEQKDFKLQSKDNKQGREYLTTGELYEKAISRLEGNRELARMDYEWMASNDVARELARIDLPLSTYTQWYWKIDLLNLMKFLTKRCAPDAQYEIRAYANVLAGMVARIAPAAFEAWIDYDLCGAKLSRMDLAVLRELLHVRPGDGVIASTDFSRQFSKDNADLFGLEPREWNELVKKLTYTRAPNFDLDLSTMQDADYFEQRMAAATPTIDKGAKE